MNGLSSSFLHNIFLELDSWYSELTVIIITLTIVPYTIVYCQWLSSSSHYSPGVLFTNVGRAYDTTDVVSYVRPTYDRCHSYTATYSWKRS